MAAFLQPVSGPVSSPFGAPRSYGPHVGVDLKVNVGTPVKAAAPGRVTVSGWVSDAAGLGVKLDHGAGYTSAYFHLSRATVNPGQYVQQGEIIGLSGATGKVTGPHLHWETRYNGRAMNPLTASYVPPTTAPVPVPLPAPIDGPPVLSLLPPTASGVDGGVLLLGFGFVVMALLIARR